MHFKVPFVQISSGALVCYNRLYESRGYFIGERYYFPLLTGCCIVMAVVCLIVSEIIMNSQKKHYPGRCKG